MQYFFIGGRQVYDMREVSGALYLGKPQSVLTNVVDERIALGTVLFWIQLRIIPLIQGYVQDVATLLSRKACQLHVEEHQHFLVWNGMSQLQVLADAELHCGHAILDGLGLVGLLVYLWSLLQFLHAQEYLIETLLHFDELHVELAAEQSCKTWLAHLRLPDHQDLQRDALGVFQQSIFEGL